VPLLIENPKAGQPEYRKHAEFQLHCNELRDLMEEAAHAQA
jgi:hypothetical protein